MKAIFFVAKKTHQEMEMRLSKHALMLGFFCLSFLAGCETKSTFITDRLTTARVETPKHCSGWEKIELKNSSRYYLLQHDQRLVVNIDAHNLRGRNLGCWQ